MCRRCRSARHRRASSVVAVSNAAMVSASAASSHASFFAASGSMSNCGAGGGGGGGGDGGGGNWPAPGWFIIAQVVEVEGNSLPTRRTHSVWTPPVSRGRRRRSPRQRRRERLGLLPSVRLLSLPASPPDSIPFDPSPSSPHPPPEQTPNPPRGPASRGDAGSAAAGALRPTVTRSNRMAMRGVDFKWYDGFFLSMLVTSVVIVSINWGRYRLCAHPLHIWIVVDYTAVFVFRLLMFLDNWLAAGMGLDLGWQQRYTRFCGRIVVLSVLVLLLYPFLWVWTVIGTLWFNSARRCLPAEGQKWGFLIWLLFSYCGLSCIACVAVGKWLNRRHALQLRAQQGIPISEYGVLVDMIRVPDWAFEAVGLELRGMGQDTAYHPGLYLTTAQREAVEALIQELPKFMLKAVPTDCSECPICLEEFRVGSEVRGLPCAHNFHVVCIDQWLRLNVKCPRCRCSVFPNLDLSALNGIRASSEQDRPSGSEVTTTAAASRYVPSAGQSYLVRLQGLLPRPVVVGHGSDDDDDAESGMRTRTAGGR